MYHLRTNAGYSLVEVLVSVTVLLTAIVGPMTIAAQGIKSSRFSGEQTTAFFLAQEGIELVMAYRDNIGLEFYEGNPSVPVSSEWINDNSLGLCPGIGVSGSCSFGLDFTDASLLNTWQDCSAGNEANCLLYYDETENRSRYSHDSVGGTELPYTRIMTLTYTDTHLVTLTSEVTWDSTIFGATSRSITLTTTIYDLYDSQFSLQTPLWYALLLEASDEMRT